MLQIFLNRFHQGSSVPLSAYLPAADALSLAQNNTESKDLSLVTASPEEKLQKVHYSWITPSIKESPEELRLFFLASLPENYAASVKKLLNITTPLPELSKEVKTFFLGLFFNKFLKLESRLPPSFLSVSKMDVLLTLNKQQLVELIDFLGLQDLAEALRHIVDKQRLKKIYSKLPTKKQQYLRICLHQKDRLGNLAPIQLSQWDGSMQKLDMVLHRKGLIRLGVALSGQQPDFVWHITQLLDTGRGGLLMKSWKEKETPNLTPSVAIQVLNLVKFLNKQG